MEALWDLEDKLKLTTHESLILLVFTSVAVAGLCTAIVLKTMARKKNVASVNGGPQNSASVEWTEPGCDWVPIKRMLMGSARWSRANKWEGSWRERDRPLLGLEGSFEAGGVGWQSQNSAASPVWQRPILMGERCQLPMFSGLILYDERGKPLKKEAPQKGSNIHQDQEAPAAVVRIKLKDLL